MDICWEAEPGFVRVRFLALPGDDKLLCEIAVNPRGKFRSLDILLRAYPSYFTAWHRVRGRRTLVTARRRAHEGRKGPTRVEIGPDENWLLLCDEVFDHGREKGRGPWAVLFLPEQVEGCLVELTNYPVNVGLKAKPAVKVVRLTPWEFPQTPNDEALSRLKKSSLEVARTLREVSFLPRPLVKAASKAKEVKALFSRLPNWPKGQELKSLAGMIQKACSALLEGERKGEVDLALEDPPLRGSRNPCERPNSKNFSPIEGRGRRWRE